MASADTDTSRVAVKTYVPAYQRDEWDDHAEELDMSRSEFVRSMVQAGRRGFDPRGSTPETGSEDDTDSVDQSSAPADGTTATEPDGTAADSPSFDERVLELLAENCLSWEQLVDELTDDVEQRLEESVQRLQAANEIQHSGRRGGYVRVE